jgi:hypothetical protein
MKTYLTPAEVIEHYPGLKAKHQWNASLVGRLLKANLLKGYYDRTLKTGMIDEDSVLDLLLYLDMQVISKTVRI